MMRAEIHLKRIPGYKALSDHFIKTNSLKNELMSCNKFSDPTHYQSTEIDDSWLSDNFKKLNQTLINHLETIKCSNAFFELMNQASFLTISWMMDYEATLRQIKNWDTSDKISDTLIDNVKHIFHNKASEITGYKFSVPEHHYYTPGNKSTEKGKYLLQKKHIKLNDDSDVFKGHCFEVLNTLIHESTHSIHSQLSNALRNAPLPRTLKPYQLDALIWHFQDKLIDAPYIPPHLSFKAYETQAIEHVAIKIGDQFQKNLMSTVLR